MSQYLSYDATCYETGGKILEEKEANIDEQRADHHPPYHLHVKFSRELDKRIKTNLCGHHCIFLH